MHRSFLLSLLLVLAAGGARAAEPPYVLRLVPDTLVANAVGEWHADLRIENHSQAGFYPDSLDLTLERDDADRTSTPRQSTRSLAPFIGIMQPAGAGDMTGVSWSAPAEFERGRLRFRLVAHDAQHQRYVLHSEVVVAGSELGSLCPPLEIEAAGQRTDGFFFATDSSSSPAPTVVYLPTSGSAARSYLRWAVSYQQRGYNVAVMSLPGAGRSRSEPDAAGPASVALVRALLNRLAHDPRVDAKRIVLWGQEDGGLTALLAAVDHPELAGVVSQDAWLDPWVRYRSLTDAEARSGFVRAAGRDSASWKARSALAVATRIPSPVLLLETLEAHLPGTAPAEAFAAQRSAAGLYVESRLSGLEPRPLRRGDAARMALDFLRRRTHTSP